MFTFQFLLYELYNGEPIPLGLKYEEELPYYLREGYKKSGLSQEEANIRTAVFGKNQHLVPALSYSEYIFNEFTKFLFLLMIFSTIINILSGTSIFGIVILGLNIIIIHINFFMQKKSQ